MANHRSAIKEHRQSLVRRARNRHYRSMVRKTIKSFHAAIEGNESAEAVKSAFLLAERAIRRTAGKGVYHARTASRTISRLAKRMNAHSAKSA